MNGSLLIDFDAEKLKTEEIRCKDIAICEDYMYYCTKNEYFIKCINFDRRQTTLKNSFRDMTLLKDVLNVGYYIHENLSKNKTYNDSIFKKNDDEASKIANAIIKQICRKYGNPFECSDLFNIYDFADFCLDLYRNYCAWIYLCEDDDITTAKQYLGIKDENKSKQDLKSLIIPVDVFDYSSPVTVNFYYDKEKDCCKRVYCCKNLCDVALLQFNLLFFSNDGLYTENANLIQVKTCKLCGREFTTTTTQKKYCDDCNKKRYAYNQRKYRDRKKIAKSKNV